MSATKMLSSSFCVSSSSSIPGMIWDVVSQDQHIPGGAWITGHQWHGWRCFHVQCVCAWFTWCTGSPGALVYWFTWGTGVLVHLGALVHMVHQCTGPPGGTGSHGAPMHWSTWGHWFTWGTGALVHLGALVHMVHRCTGSPGALVHWSTWGH